MIISAITLGTATFDGFYLSNQPTCFYAANLYVAVQSTYNIGFLCTGYTQSYSFKWIFHIISNLTVQ